MFCFWNLPSSSEGLFGFCLVWSSVILHKPYVDTLATAMKAKKKKQVDQYGYKITYNTTTTKSVGDDH